MIKGLSFIPSQFLLLIQSIENVEWLGAQSDIAVLLPFVLSHHDPRTSKFWPTITAEGLAALPMLVQIHAACWKLAPFDPVSRDAQVAHSGKN